MDLGYQDGLGFRAEVAVGSGLEDVEILDCLLKVVWSMGTS